MKHKAIILTLTAITGGIIMACEPTSDFWFVPFIGAAVLAISVIVGVKANEN